MVFLCLFGGTFLAFALVVSRRGTEITCSVRALVLAFLAIFIGLFIVGVLLFGQVGAPL